MYNHWSNYVIIVCVLLYLAYAMYRSMHTTTCTTCGTRMQCNGDPNITDCWACESISYTTGGIYVMYTPMYNTLLGIKKVIDMDLMEAREEMDTDDFIMWWEQVMEASAIMVYVSRDGEPCLVTE